MESSSTNSDPLIGSFIGGKYRIIEKLGAGGMGGVYKAEHQLMNRMVAVKVLRSNLVHDEILLKRFHHEAKAASQISHPNAVVLFDYGVENDMPFLVMEYIEGKTLKMVIADEKPLSVKRVAEILRQICSALDQAHRAGIVHRDVKPDNFMVRKGHEGEDIVKVLDFGVSKSIGLGGMEEKDNNLTQAGTIIGTPQYISPEQCQGKELDARCDIYSLGVVTYEMLSGTAPFTAPTVLELLVKVLHHQAEPIRKFKPELNLPAAVDAAVMKAIEKDRDKRYSKILDFYHDFAKGAGVDQKPIEAAPAKLPRSVIALSAMIVLALLFLILRPPAAGPNRAADEKKLQQLSDAVKRAETEKAEALATAARLKKEAEELLRNNDLEKAKIVQEQAAAAERAEREKEASLQNALSEKTQMDALVSKMKQTAEEKEQALRNSQEAARKAVEEKVRALQAAEAARIEAEKQSAAMKAQVDKEKREALQRELEMAAQLEKEKAAALKSQQEAAAKAEKEKEEALKQMEAAKAEAARLGEMAKQMEREKEAALKQMEAAQKQQALQAEQAKKAVPAPTGSTATTVVVAPDPKAVEAAKEAARKAKENQEKLAEAIRKANEQKEEAIRRAEQTRLEAARQAAAARKAEEEARQMRAEAERRKAEEQAVPPEQPTEEQPKKRRRCGPTWCL